MAEQGRPADLDPAERHEKARKNLEDALMRSVRSGLISRKQAQESMKNYDLCQKGARKRGRKWKKNHPGQ